MSDDATTVPDYGLKCKACGYFLAGLPRHICPECGRAFTLEEFIPPGEFPVVFMEGKPVQAERDVRDLMTRYHIPFMEKNSLSDSQMLAVGTKAHAPGQLCVPREAYFDVLDLLRRVRLNLELPPPPDNSAADVEWTCPACSESNPGTFELCWNCERERA
ncbi:MAG: hypothetical protein AABZ08_12760 [Planctomycetota bacterium]